MSPTLALRSTTGRASVQSAASSLKMAAVPEKSIYSSEGELILPRGAGVDVYGIRENNQGRVWVPQRARPRRNRKNEGVRAMTRENEVKPANFIYPLFVFTKDTNEPIASMPGALRHTRASVMKEVGEAIAEGVRNIILFPKVPDDVKTNTAEECFNAHGLIPSLISEIKEKYGMEVNVWTDVALDPYSDQGHDGMVSNDKRGDGGHGRVMNDETVEQLCRQAIAQARAGADTVAPSDMMDGRIGAIRDALDSEGFTDTSIVAYSAKYASAFYGPFRDALDSAPRESSNAPPNKKTYQMDPANSREALIEAQLDAAEGADMLMVKPGMPYLDIIKLLKDNTNLPISAYHVSGEYAMLKAAAEKGWVDEKAVCLETLLCFKRAGADAILTYYAKQAARWLNE